MAAQDVVGAVEAVLERGGDADDVLREVVASLVGHGAAWAGLLLVEDGRPVLGPHAGAEQPERRLEVPVRFDGAHVADLAVDGWPGPALLDRVAELIGPYCLVGWDTGGIPWEEL